MGMSKAACKEQNCDPFGIEAHGGRLPVVSPAAGSTTGYKTSIPYGMTEASVSMRSVNLERPSNGVDRQARAQAHAYDGVWARGENARFSLQPLRLGRPVRAWALFVFPNPRRYLGLGLLRPFGARQQIGIRFTAFAVAKLLHLHLPMVGFTAETPNGWGWVVKKSILKIVARARETLAKSPAWESAFVTSQIVAKGLTSDGFVTL